MIPESFIQDLLSRIDIVEVVGKYVKLKKSGAGLVGSCPFHSEKSPSFTVSQVKQFYHCFGCGAHGTVITFLVKYSGLGFVEAVEELAQSVNVKLPDRNDRVSRSQSTVNLTRSRILLDAMATANSLYKTHLRGSQQAIRYLKSRGITGEIAAKFELGYSLASWDNLKSFPSSFEPETLIESGLLIRGKNDYRGDGGRYYARFRDRIIFPIRNVKGQIVGFGGRSICNEKKPKYLNSPETSLFQKSRELYGLFEARQAIRDSGYVIVTEGYMDVLALVQLGFPQSVATLGTACTAAHVRKLSCQTDSIIFSFDGDDAGHKAARRVLDSCLHCAADNKEIKFVFLPKEQDPDSFVRTVGADAFGRLVRGATPLSKFLLDEVTAKTDLSTPEGRARAQYNAKPLIKLMPLSSLRLQIVRELSQLTRSTPREIEYLFESGSPADKVALQRKEPFIDRPPPVDLEKQVILLLAVHPTLSLELDSEALEVFPHFKKGNLETLTYLTKICQSIDSQADFSTVIDLLNESSKDFRSLIAEVILRSNSRINDARLELSSVIRQIKVRISKKELSQIAEAGIRDRETCERYRRLMKQQEAWISQGKVDAKVLQEKSKNP